MPLEVSDASENFDLETVLCAGCVNIGIEDDRFVGVGVVHSPTFTHGHGKHKRKNTGRCRFLRDTLIMRLDALYGDLRA